MTLEALPSQSTASYALIEVTLLDVMGDDLTVVNAARVSFAKESREFSEKDGSLLAYLATHRHYSPFAHPQLSFRVKAPIFLARQLAKHQVGLAWNEVSRRYVDTDIEFFDHPGWNYRAEDKKQGSGGKVTDVEEAMYHYVVQHNALSSAVAAYNSLIASGIAPEQARAVLPQSLMTTWVWTGSLFAFFRVCQLRGSEDAQSWLKPVIDGIEAGCARSFPESFRVLHSYWGDV